jgi:RHS repeat-associated protein
VAQVAEPDGNIRQLHRDPEGNVLEVRDGVGSRRFSYTGMGWLASVEEDGAKVAFAYEPEGELREIQNEKRHPYSFWYDPCRRMNRVRGFDRRYIDYKRDKAGQVVEIKRAGAKTTIAYDEVGNITGHVYADGTSDKFIYGPDGLLDEAENATIALKFERDVLGRVTKEFQGNQWVSSTAMRVTRDEAGNPQSISLGPVYSPRQIDFTRDAEGFEVERRLPGDVTAHWHYDQAGSPAALRVRRGQSAEWAQEYVWNLDDRLSALVDSHFGKSEFVHDGRRRLIAAQFDGQTQHRSLDAVGNVYKTRDQKDRSFASGGVIRNDGDTTFAFDGLGNMVARHEPGGSDWTYAWDGAGMLTEVVRPDGKRVAMTYDPLGRRVSKSMDGVETRWMWSGNTVLHETKTGQADATWYHEPDGFAPLAKVVGEQTLFVVSDHLGTPTAMYDGAGKLAWRMQLDLFGIPKEGSFEGGEACPWRWPGQYEDREIGLYYNRFRYYDPSLGQYISQDPIGLDGGIATYAYVRDPGQCSDPFALSCQRLKTHVFWSGAGDPRVRQAAEKWSRTNRATTLEMTGHGSHLERHTQTVDWLESGPAWRKASRHFAKRAAEGEKEVHVFVNQQGVASTSVWKTVEEPILNAYPNLTIIVHPV